MNRSNFKTDENYSNFFKCHPKMQEIGQFIVEVTKRHGGHCVFTETKTTGTIDKALGRVSNSHEQGRALDQRTWNLRPESISLIINEVKTKYGTIGAISKDGKRNLAVHHNSGHGDHIHWQIDRSFSVA